MTDRPSSLQVEVKVSFGVGRRSHLPPNRHYLEAKALVTPCVGGNVRVTDKAPCTRPQTDLAKRQSPPCCLGVPTYFADAMKRKTAAHL